VDGTHRDLHTCFEVRDAAHVTCKLVPALATRKQPGASPSLLAMSAMCSIAAAEVAPLQLAGMEVIFVESTAPYDPPARR
jgi:hypothetical protein